MADRARRLAEVGSGLGVAVALLIGGLRLANTPAPQLRVEWPGLFVFTLVYALPFALALLAARRFRPRVQAAVWLAAALLALLAAFTAFSAVTLPFLLPAFLLAVAAFLTLSRQSLGRWPAALGWAAVLAVLGGAAFALLLLLFPSQGGCWQLVQVDGQSVWQSLPYQTSMRVGEAVQRSFCTSDLITPLEAGLAMLPWIAAVLLVWRLDGLAPGEEGRAAPVPQ